MAYSFENGIKGVRSMYENVKARIRCGAKFMDCINCTRGVKQGDVCSLSCSHSSLMDLPLIYNLPLILLTMADME